ncbi:MAG TPA: hypothetical protein VKM35_05875 [Arenimonas sp.]|uniref:hypothetical protein n=1 Tax=Arenimonas sp. TaxID=1872635 RepID=UPI002C54C78F|nr:hypothetical protein [Arenimonas sp.]HMB56718.1 hypothetical protein [Arenimonas sp.]
MASLVWGMLFGSIGFGYFIYGKKQSQLLPLFCGIGLMLFPYFVDGTAWMLLIGGLLMAAPFLRR